jgi:hypothetical protein
MASPALYRAPTRLRQSFGGRVKQSSEAAEQRRRKARNKFLTSPPRRLIVYLFLFSVALRLCVNHFSFRAHRESTAPSALSFPFPEHR